MSLVSAPPDPVPAPAPDPKPDPSVTPDAIVKAPKVVPVGGTVFLDATASVFDPSQPLQWQSVEPENLALLALDQKGRVGVVAVFIASEPREYLVAVTAIGHDAQGKVIADTAVVRVVAGAGPKPMPDPGPDPAPIPPGPDGTVDARLIPTGQSYSKALGPDLGRAVEDGAKLLDAGQTRAAANDVISKAFSANRQSSYDSLVTPAFEQVVPQSTPEASLTADQRKALAKAYRGFARGLKGVQ